MIDVELLYIILFTLHKDPTGRYIVLFLSKAREVKKFAQHHIASRLLSHFLKNSSQQTFNECPLAHRIPCLQGHTEMSVLPDHGGLHSPLRETGHI